MSSMSEEERFALALAYAGIGWINQDHGFGIRRQLLSWDWLGLADQEGTYLLCSRYVRRGPMLRLQEQVLVLIETQNRYRLKSPGFGFTKEYGVMTVYLIKFVRKDEHLIDIVAKGRAMTGYQTQVVMLYIIK